MTNRIGMALSLACVLCAAGCSSHKKDGKKVDLDRGVTDLTPSKATPASSVPPDPSFVSVPAAASQPKFVPVDAPAPVAPLFTPAADPMGGVTAAPASYAPSTYAPSSYAPPAPYAAVTPVFSRTPAAPASPSSAPAGGAGRQYLVRKGDTLFRIAKTHYGDGNRWQQIAMLNPGLTPATLQAGATIVVP